MKHCLLVIISLLFLLVACTDYVGPIDERIEERNAHELARDESMVLVSKMYVEPCKTDTLDTCEYGTFEDERDGQIYRTVTIGSLTWLAENLNYDAKDSYCYEADAKNCAKYGRLYTWAAAMDSAGVFDSSGKGCGYGELCAPTYPVRGVCPSGWHLPSYGEWHTLFAAVEADSHGAFLMGSGSVLKSETGWDQDYNEDSYGFAVLPAGAWMDIEKSGALFYSGMESVAYFWMATEETRDEAYSFYIDSDSPHREMASKEYGYSVRCVKDVADKKTERDSSDQTLKSSSSRGAEEVERSSSSVESSESSDPDESSSSIEYGTLVDARDGRTYRTVTIGSQVWMAENLSYDAKGSYCRDDPDDCEKYGRYYTWAMAMDSVGEFSDNGLGCGYDTICEPTYPVRGICPEGWHLPRGGEFGTLIETAGGESGADVKLKSKSGWKYYENGEDAYGFNALPASRFSGYAGEFYEVGDYAIFWSSSGGSERSSANIFGLGAEEAFAFTTDDSRYDGFSVRCVKD